MGNIAWDESQPSDTGAAGLGDDAFRSLKTTLRIGLDTEHIWPSGGGDAGVHRLGSARAYYGPESTVSSAGTDGKLMVTSDTSRFFHVGSGGTSFLGGPRVISIGTDTGFTYPQRHHWVEEIGIAAISLGTFRTSVSIPNSGFSGVPYVFVSQNEGTPAGGVQYSTSALDITSSAFNIYIDRTAASVVSVAWRSLGTRVL